MSVTVQIPVELTDQFLSDVLVTAFDGAYGGCWYWAEPDGEGAYQIDPRRDVWCRVRIVERGDPTEISPASRRHFEVTHELLAAGMEKILRSEVLPARGDLRAAILEQDGGNIDAGDADTIVQIACFGDLVYG